MNKSMFILGGTGFIGHEVVIQGVDAGWQVKALVRSEEGADRMRRIGALPIAGAIHRPEAWIAEVHGSTAMIDLTQPKFPKRLGRSAIKSLSTERQAMTRVTLGALRTLPAEERPILFSVSGADDLQPCVEPCGRLDGDVDSFVGHKRRNDQKRSGRRIAAAREE